MAAGRANHMMLASAEMVKYDENRVILVIRGMSDVQPLPSPWIIQIDSIPHTQPHHLEVRTHIFTPVTSNVEAKDDQPRN
jgi:hypothetical protein